jgi:hypothetical protein
MAVVQGIKERVHHPVYDSISVDAGQQLVDVEKTGVLKFFVNVNGKTKLKTNLQSASLLPHYNTFEARALRVVISDQPPSFPDGEIIEDADYDVIAIDAAGRETHVDVDGVSTADPAAIVSADLELSMRRIFELLNDARQSDDGYVELEVLEEGVILLVNGSPLTEAQAEAVDRVGAVVPVHKEDLEGMIEKLEPESRRPPIEQLRLNDGAGTLIGKFIYNTVTTFYVGEKAMIQMPTWFFPAGAGPHSDTVKHVTHGEPTPLATFRFAEPIYIDRQQPFRVEIEVPESERLREFQRIYGPFQIWVVLDGFMTRDVQ